MSNRIFVVKIENFGLFEERRKIIETYDNEEHFLKAYDSNTLMRVLTESETFHRYVENEKGQVFTTDELKLMFDEKSRNEKNVRGTTKKSVSETLQ
jgi:hypothetical protein